MKTYKKVPINGGFTEKVRNMYAEKAKKTWERKGWTVVSRIDGGITGKSYLEMEKEDDQLNSKGEEFENVMKTIIGFFVLIILIILIVALFWFFGGDDEKTNTQSTQSMPIANKKENKENVDISIVKQKASDGGKQAQFEFGIAYYTGEGIGQNKSKAFEWFEKAAIQGHAIAQQNLGVMYVNGEGVEASHKKAVQAFEKAIELGSEESQDLLNKVIRAYDDTQSVIVGVLSSIWSDTNKAEKKLNDFLKTLTSNDIIKIVSDAQNNHDKIRELVFKSYTPSAGKTYKEIDDKEAIKNIEDLIEYSQMTNLYLQLYYSSSLEYIDNQKPTLLVKAKDNMDTYQSLKLSVIAKSFEISEKYDLAYDDDLEHWRTKNSIEADQDKKSKE